MSLIIKNGSIKKSSTEAPGAGQGKMTSANARHGLMKLKQHVKGAKKSGLLK